MIGKKRPAQLQRPANAVRLLRASLSNTASAIIYPTKTDIGSSAVSAELTAKRNFTSTSGVRKTANIGRNVQFADMNEKINYFEDIHKRN